MLRVRAFVSFRDVTAVRFRQRARRIVRKTHHVYVFFADSVGPIEQTNFDIAIRLPFG
jgi:hypothetical protein